MYVSEEMWKLLEVFVSGALPPHSVSGCAWLLMILVDCCAMTVSFFFNLNHEKQDHHLTINESMNENTKRDELLWMILLVQIAVNRCAAAGWSRRRDIVNRSVIVSASWSGDVVGTCCWCDNQWRLLMFRRIKSGRSSTRSWTTVHLMMDDFRAKVPPDVKLLIGCVVRAISILFRWRWDITKTSTRIITQLFHNRFKYILTFSSSVINNVIL